MSTRSLTRVTSGALFVRSIGRVLRFWAFMFVALLSGFVIGTAAGNDLVAFATKAVISQATDTPQEETSWLPWKK